MEHPPIVNDDDNDDDDAALTFLFCISTFINNKN